ncbi:hypothetical protein THAOC_12166 [Thalassiosira oceanica]|uniref:Uncharacterized protein n=1 Tax=Thalassiosira oceanica TaxID=159749 RepID=K0T0P6_THAOC|nr:hypothetical protein THAOC_12166 [Thalassiosira oceanica]|eukprot:EJK66866.1 hypothetical protein THAOC_12166 [Thalassiosira oceanica]
MTGRSVPLAGFPRGVLEEGSRPRIAAAAHRPAVGPTSTPQGPWTNNACGHNSTLISHVQQPIGSTFLIGVLTLPTASYLEQNYVLAITRPSIAHVTSRSCRVGWKMPNAPVTGLSSLELGLDSTPTHKSLHSTRQGGQSRPIVQLKSE